MSLTATHTLQPIPYLSFDGNCEEAMRFYEATFGGQIVHIMRGKDTPAADQMPPDMLEGVVNAHLSLPGGGILYAGDIPKGRPYHGINGVMLTLILPTVEEAEGVFSKLSAGGTIDMPFAPSFWAKGFGMCTDKYGTPWAINGEMAM